MKIMMDRKPRNAELELVEARYMEQFDSFDFRVSGIICRFAYFRKKRR